MSVEEIINRLTVMSDPFYCFTVADKLQQLTAENERLEEVKEDARNGQEVVQKQCDALEVEKETLILTCRANDCLTKQLQEEIKAQDELLQMYKEELE